MPSNLSVYLSIIYFYLSIYLSIVMCHPAWIPPPHPGDVETDILSCNRLILLAVRLIKGADLNPLPFQTPPPHLHGPFLIKGTVSPDFWPRYSSEKTPAIRDNIILDYIHCPKILVTFWDIIWRIAMTTKYNINFSYSRTKHHFILQTLTVIYTN